MSRRGRGRPKGRPLTEQERQAADRLAAKLEAQHPLGTPQWFPARHALGTPYLTEDEAKQVEALTEVELDRVMRLLLPRESDSPRRGERGLSLGALPAGQGLTREWVGSADVLSRSDHRRRLGLDPTRPGNLEYEYHLPFWYRVAELIARQRCLEARRHRRPCDTKETMIGQILYDRGVWDLTAPPTTNTLQRYRRAVEAGHFAREIIDAAILYVHQTGVRLVLS